MIRLHVDQPLQVGQGLRLPEPAFRHAVQVLRLRQGEALILFNGDGHDYHARLCHVARREAQAEILNRTAAAAESPLRITLVQGVSKGDRMDFAVQKAVELGVHAIAPVITQRCNVRLDAQRWAKKAEHWRGVVISACEQSGRARIPELTAPAPLADWLSRPRTGLALLLDPRAAQSMADLGDDAKSVELLIGPEGGLAETEVNRARAAGYLGLRLGPRVLRTETAALAALAMLQLRFGDF